MITRFEVAGIVVSIVLGIGEMVLRRVVDRRGLRRHDLARRRQPDHGLAEETRMGADGEGDPRRHPVDQWSPVNRIRRSA
ncbi:hypothetical protein [Amycolatopsis sp. RTGN1]|uniref:hypothetical protein n=1 Tax=Amycolatopsis ponsaeliensis TaxID=2992142 RepID=UPI00254D3230|nr:hypothetical protein [Amycolatopsis sp. RTGN1]